MYSLFRRDVMTIWQQVELQNRLVQYREIFQGKRLPRYKLARLFYVSFDNYGDKNDLMSIHEHFHPKFVKWLKEKQTQPIEEIEQEVFSNITEKEIEQNNYLKLKSELLNNMLSACEFCENKCKTNRFEGKVGKCGVDGEAYVSSAFIHMGEESPIIPSGTIFFYGCTINCQFCQNWDISHTFDLDRLKGRGTSAVQLAAMFYSLVKQNARNINFVGGEPTPNLHRIVEALLISQVNVPMLWNSNMYLTETSMKIISDLFDIWLPDMKYSNNECSLKYSKAPTYWETLQRNMKMIENRGSGEYIIRHLVMPAHTKCCSIPLLDWINENLETPLVNIMSQYHPDYRVLQTDKFPEIGRKVTTGEMHEVRSHADKLGLFWKSVS